MRVLLHICCAVCATAVVESLRRESYQVNGYFYNPNIQPRKEYLRRLESAEQLARQQKFPLVVGEYDLDEWLLKVQGLENEPEKSGKRCASCFTLRLEQTASFAQEKGFNFFTTTLTVSPHKDAQVINEIGQRVGQGRFLVHDFKKQNGFKRAQELSRQYGLYHQDYCGCAFSLKEGKDGRIHQAACSFGSKGKTA
ncbi:MAG: epoxyqueuosine reductase QueH [Candidatus Omnitrophica bacterium]|nr:epoxyqueuosine reductase QueH [Candidatus Omnitrophota bacterium]